MKQVKGTWGLLYMELKCPECYYEFDKLDSCFDKYDQGTKCSIKLKCPECKEKFIANL